MMRFLFVAVVVVLSAPVSAQNLVVTQYQLTRMAPAPVVSTIFQKTAMTCGLARGIPPSTGLRIEDPLSAALDCQLLGTINGVLVAVVPGQPSDYRIMAATAEGLWSPEHVLTNVVPPSAPTGGRVRPPFSASIGAEGVVLGPLTAFGGVQVANVLLDGYNLLVHFGAPTLTVPGYDVRPGDRFAFTFGR